MDTPLFYKQKFHINPSLTDFYPRVFPMIQAIDLLFQEFAEKYQDYEGEDKEDYVYDESTSFVFISPSSWEEDDIEERRVFEQKNSEWFAPWLARFNENVLPILGQLLAHDSDERSMFLLSAPANRGLLFCTIKKEDMGKQFLALPEKVDGVCYEIFLPDQEGCTSISRRFLYGDEVFRSFLENGTA